MFICLCRKQSRKSLVNWLLIFDLVLKFVEIVKQKRANKCDKLRQSRDDALKRLMSACFRKCLLCFLRLY